MKRSLITLLMMLTEGRGQFPSMSSVYRLGGFQGKDYVDCLRYMPRKVSVAWLHTAVDHFVSPLDGRTHDIFKVSCDLLQDLQKLDRLFVDDEEARLVLGYAVGYLKTFHIVFSGDNLALKLAATLRFASLMHQDRPRSTAEWEEATSLCLNREVEYLVSRAEGGWGITAENRLVHVSGQAPGDYGVSLATGFLAQVSGQRLGTEAHQKLVNELQPIVGAVVDLIPTHLRRQCLGVACHLLNRAMRLAKPIPINATTIAHYATAALRIASRLAGDALVPESRWATAARLRMGALDSSRRDLVVALDTLIANQPEPFIDSLRAMGSNDSVFASTLADQMTRVLQRRMGRSEHVPTNLPMAMDRFIDRILNQCFLNNADRVHACCHAMAYIDALQSTGHKLDEATHQATLTAAFWLASRFHMHFVAPAKWAKLGGVSTGMIQELERAIRKALDERLTCTQEELTKQAQVLQLEAVPEVSSLDTMVAGPFARLILAMNSDRPVPADAACYTRVVQSWPMKPFVQSLLYHFVRIPEEQTLVAMHALSYLGRMMSAEVPVPLTPTTEKGMVATALCLASNMVADDSLPNSVWAKSLQITTKEMSACVTDMVHRLKWDVAQLQRSALIPYASLLNIELPEEEGVPPQGTLPPLAIPVPLKRVSARREVKEEKKRPKT